MPKITTVDRGLALDTPLPASQRPKHSGFFITINTNVAPAADDVVACAQALRESVNAMLNKEENLKRIIDYIDGTGGWDDLDDIKSEQVVEQGSRQHRLHAHVVIHIEHRTKIRLNRAEIEKVIMDNFDHTQCDVKKLYVNIKAITGAGSIEAYLTKGINVNSLKQQ